MLIGGWNRLTWWTARLHMSQNRITLLFWHSPSIQIEQTASSSIDGSGASPLVCDWKCASFSNRSIINSNVVAFTMLAPYFFLYTFMIFSHAASCTNWQIIENSQNRKLKPCEQIIVYIKRRTLVYSRNKHKLKGVEIYRNEPRFRKLGKITLTSYFILKYAPVANGNYVQITWSSMSYSTSSSNSSAVFSM